MEELGNVPAMKSSDNPPSVNEGAGFFGCSHGDMGFVVQDCRASTSFHVGNCLERYNALFSRAIALTL